LYCFLNNKVEENKLDNKILTTTTQDKNKEQVLNWALSLLYFLNEIEKLLVKFIEGIMIILKEMKGREKKECAWHQNFEWWSLKKSEKNSSVRIQTKKARKR